MFEIFDILPLTLNQGPNYGHYCDRYILILFFFSWKVNALEYHSSIYLNNLPKNYILLILLNVLL